MDFTSLKNYVEPAYDKHAFTCQHCGTYTTHSPETGYVTGSVTLKLNRSVHSSDRCNVLVTTCLSCQNIHIFIRENEAEKALLLYPFNLKYEGYQPPCEDMLENIRDLYNEASQVLKYSPRSASALLRFALESLLKDVCETTPKKDNLAGYIEQFIKENVWAEQYEFHLTELRLVGNNAVHGGKNEIDFFENLEEAKQDCLVLFDFLNRIVEETYTKKRKDKEFFNKRGTENQINKAKKQKQSPVKERYSP